MKKQILFLFIVLCIVDNAIAAPSITTVTNSKTNDDSTYVLVEYQETVTYNITTNESITTYYWWVDNTSISNNFSDLSYSFVRPFYHNITVQAENPNGSVMFSWSPQCERQLAVTTSDLASENATDAITDSIEDNTDFPAFLAASLIAYEQIFGALIWVFIWGSYFVMAWTRQESILNVSMVGLIVGIVLFTYLPEDWSATAIPLILLGATATIFSLYKER